MYNIICFGDSNTHGYNSKTGGRFEVGERYPTVLQELLGSKYYVAEEGVSGRTNCLNDPIEEGLNGLEVITPCLLTHEPIDLLIIMLGTNDTKQRFNLTSKNIAMGLRRLVLKAMNTKGVWRNNPNVLIITPVSIDERYKDTYVFETMGEGCSRKSKELHTYYQEVANELGCLYLDANTIEGIELYPYDYMHLSKDGHRALAKKLAEIILELDK